MSLLLFSLLFSTLALLFAGLLRFSRVVDDARFVLRAAQESMDLIRDQSLSDRHKEKAIQAASGRLFKTFLRITVKCLLALAVPGAVVFAMLRAGLIDQAELFAAATHWAVILSSSTVAVGAMLVRR